MPESYPIAKSSLSYAKLVATPTTISWSQAYNAGNIFVVLSLTMDEGQEDILLQSLGKDIFSLFQSEFFGLEKKAITTIKKAITIALEKVPDGVVVSFAMAFFREPVLFVFMAGSGKIILKRGEGNATLLENQENDNGTVMSASGYLQNEDTVVLETGELAQTIPQSLVANALTLAMPNDIVEALSPQVHEQSNGAQAAIVIMHHGPNRKDHIVAESILPEDPTIANLYDAEHQEYEEEPQRSPFSLPSLPLFPVFHYRPDHRTKLFLSIAGILVILLSASIMFTTKKNADTKQQSLFQTIYPPAEQYYETGQGLESLNPALSQDNYQKAKKLLQDGETKIGKGSGEYKQIEALLAKVDHAIIGESAPTDQSTKATAVEAPTGSLLAFEKVHADGLAYGEGMTAFYIITDKVITSFSKSGGEKTDVIKNDGDWSAPKAIVSYQSNLYVLDQQKGVLKFVPASSSGYGKSAYFKSNTPDVSAAMSMAIDSDVWIVLRDGTLLKYTKGESDNLQVTGLKKPMKNPTKIVTDGTLAYVYVLDKGNSRIVSFDKHGVYHKEYIASVLAQAVDFTVSEKENKLLILSGGKVWQITL
jgi:hypothetical protein